MELKEFLQEKPDYLKQVEQMEAEAELGRRYLAELKGEVARLGGLVENGMEAGLLERMADKLGCEELEGLKKAYSKRLEGKYPIGPQLRYESGKAEREGFDGAFLI